MKRILFALTSLLAAGSLITPALRAQDDRDASTPTAWLWYYGQTPAQVSSRVANGYRIVDLEVQQVSPLRFSVALVKNTGAYAKGWWWYYGLDGASLSQKLSQNQGRLIDLEPYDVGGQTRFAAVMVHNSGQDAKAWWYYYGTSTATISQNASLHNARIVDLDQYTIGGVSKKSAVMISNTGDDAKGWWWYLNVSPAFISQKLSDNGARLYDLERVGGNTFNVVMVKRQGEAWWWYHGMTAEGLSEKIAQTGSRIIDLETRVDNGVRRFDAILINNSNALTTRIGEILRDGTDGQSGLYLKRVNGPVLAGLRQNFVFEPASSIKVLLHTHAMKRVQNGTASLGEPVTVFTGTNGSCPQYFNPVIEPLETVLRKMMENSDNNRTMAIRDKFGELNINLTAAALGMSNTSLNHTIGCGAPAIADPNELTLVDLGKLHEAVANGYLGSQRDKFYDLMLQSRTSFAGGLLENIIDAEAAALGMPGFVLNAFKANVEMAYKGGSYTLTSGATRYYRSRFSWVQLPFKTGPVITPVEYVTGIFVHAASDETAAVNALNEAAAELLREQIRAALKTWNHHVTGTFGSMGSGCEGSNGTPLHFATGTPEIGGMVSYKVADVPAWATTFLHVGFSPTSFMQVVLPFSMEGLGAPGCVIYAGPEMVLSQIADGGGNASRAISIPNDGSLVGLDVYTQFLNMDPLANPLGVTASNALQTMIGGYY